MTSNVSNIVINRARESDIIDPLSIEVFFLLGNIGTRYAHKIHVCTRAVRSYIHDGIGRGRVVVRTHASRKARGGPPLLRNRL